MPNPTDQEHESHYGETKNNSKLRVKILRIRRSRG